MIELQFKIDSIDGALLTHNSEEVTGMSGTESMLAGINLASPLFHAPWGNVTGQNLLDIGTLVILEGLLSFDNALALAATVKSRLSDPVDRKRALRYGIWGAYFFRTLVIFLGVTLMKIEWVKAVAAAYLIWLAVTELWPKNGKEDVDDALPDPHERGISKFFRLSPLWSTILAVELMDIMFSIDSIGVAFAISSEPWILVTGAVLGILMMRLAATLFVKLIDRFPVLVKTAFILVGLAGINMVLKLKNLPLGPLGELTIDKEIPEHVFTLTLALIFFGAMGLNALFPKWFAKEEGAQVAV
jgi:YkoY family integral membrane protein